MTDLRDVIDQLRSKFYGKYRGTVTEVDPDTLRLKAKVPDVLPDGTSGWAAPCVPYAGKGVGIAFLPEPGAGVWIEFERGDPSYPIWSGCYWRAGEPPPDAAPAVKAIVTKKHKLLFDDDAGTITISDANGNKVTLSADGILLERGSGKVQVGDAGVSVNDGALDVQ